MYAASLVLTLASLAATASANCMYGTSLQRRAEGEVEVSNFGYSGETGPLNWAAIDPANSACSTSKVQSPIVLDASIPMAASAPVVSIANVEEAEFENLGTTLEVVISGTTTFEGTDFELQQFHFHTPSEHRINEEYFPLEMHMVHESADGSIAVISVPFQLTEDGSTTDLLTSVITDIAAVTTPGTVTKTGPLDFTALINAIQTTPLFQYTGSLTTPPCAEGLTFLVVSEPLPLNVATYNSLKRTIKYNARFSQNSLGQTNLLEVASKLSISLNPDVAAVCPIGGGVSAANVTEVAHVTEAVKVEHTTSSAVAAHATTLVAENIHNSAEANDSAQKEVAQQCNSMCNAKYNLNQLHARHHARRSHSHFH